MSGAQKLADELRSLTNDDFWHLHGLLNRREREFISTGLSGGFCQPSTVGPYAVRPLKRKRSAPTPGASQ